MKEQDKL